MANNRLYLVDTSTNEYLCLAKCHGVGWCSGNRELYDEFLLSRYNDHMYESHLIVVSESDDDLYDKWIANGKNYNTENIWTK